MEMQGISKVLVTQTFPARCGAKLKSWHNSEPNGKINGRMSEKHVLEVRSKHVQLAALSRGMCGCHFCPTIKKLQCCERQPCSDRDMLPTE